MSRLWFRHLLKRLAKHFSLVMAGIFLAYAAIDLSVHGVRFFHGQANAKSLCLYYLDAFSLQFDLFSSFAFLFAILILTNDLMRHAECVALHMAGLSCRRLAAPFFALALFLMGLSYANAEWMFPKASQSIGDFRAKHAKKKRSVLREFVHVLTLDDGSELVYQRFDASQKSLYDVYWIRSFDDIYHFKKLETSGAAHFAEHYLRAPDDCLALTEAEEQRILPELCLSSKEALRAFTPFEERKLSILAQQSFAARSDKPAIRAHFLEKICRPLVFLLLVCTLLPPLLAFSRSKNTFLAAALSLSALVSWQTLLGGMLILAENQALPPLAALGLPWLLASGAAVRKFFSC